jgi:diphthine-ammonia ligase
MNQQQRPKGIALISGGKDSLLSLYHAIVNGYEIVALGNLHPRIETVPVVPSESCTVDETGTYIYQPTTTVTSLGPKALVSDELDSYMYQTVGHTLLPLYAQCLGLPLYRRAINGRCVNTALDYSPSSAADDETEDLMQLLSSILKRHPSATVVTSGAILSTYQRTRIESVCTRLSLTSLAYLWQMHQESVLEQLQTLGFDARIVKVAALGLDPRWLWANVTDADTITKLELLKDKWGINVAGEGGEYETLVVGAPGWRGKIDVPEEARVVKEDGGGGAAWVEFLKAEVILENLERCERQVEWVQGLGQQALLDHEFEKFLEAVGEASVEDTTELVDIHKDLAIDMPVFSKDVLNHSILITSTTLYISNLTSPNPHTTIEAETAAVFGRLSEILSTYNINLPSITSITILLRDMSTFSCMNAAYTKFFPLPLPPSRICLSTPLLPSTHNIFLSCHVPLPIPKTTLSNRKGLHVQSRSYWAPANIGPYSQAILSAGWWEVAGQIPLIPASMELVSPLNHPLGCVLALQHLVRIWNAVGAKGLAAIAWVVDPQAVNAAVETWKGRGAGPVIVCSADALPRGAGVEWVGYAIDPEVYDSDDENNNVDIIVRDGADAEQRVASYGKRSIGVYFEDGDFEGMVNSLARKAALSDEDELVTVYVPITTPGMLDFEAVWKQKGGKNGVREISVGAVWDWNGKRRGIGMVVRTG